VKVLVTDGEQSQTLAAVRALGQEGVHVVVGSSARTAVSFFSRYSAEKLVYPSPARKESAFIEWVLHTAKSRRIDVVLPIGYSANVLFSRHREALSRVTRLAIADDQAMAIASDKQKTMAFADSLGVPVPRTYRSAAEVRAFPVVVKSALGTGNVTYVNSRAELQTMNLEQAVIQEYIPGSGFGFYGLFNHGSLRAVFMHRRIRELPVTGGASTAAAAYHDQRLHELGVKLMAGLRWHGVAMVEMKRDDRDGQYKLMEINPKFWGSLDLSIGAGVNFPYLACRMALEGDVKPVLEYDRTTRFHWPFPHDLLHAIARPTSAKQVLADFLDREVKSNLSRHDWRPNLFLIAMTPVQALSRALRGKLFRPHGAPRLG
jgi:predicted ATP-grasp superfamily ATP-dependent carboligase